MRLLVDCHCFDYPTPQGINTYLRGLYGSLIYKTTNIEIFLTANNLNNLKNIFGERENITYLRIPAKGSLSRLLSIFPSLIKENRIDVAHFQYVAPFIKNCKTIVTLHDILFKDFPQYFPISYRITKNILFKYTAKRADILLTVSEYSKKQIAKHYNICESKIDVTPNAIIDRFSSISPLDARKYVKKHYGINTYILYVSRLEPRKDQFGLLQSYIKSKLYLEDIDLVIVGEESIRDIRIPKLLATLSKDVSLHIHFLNGILDEALTYLFKGASLFVYPSKAEGFGIPPLEAAISEIPTICNKATAMSDFDFFKPRLIDTSNPDILSALMRDCITNPPAKDELIAIKKIVMERYNWNRIASNYLEMLARI